MYMYTVKNKNVVILFSKWKHNSRITLAVSITIIAVIFSSQPIRFAGRRKG